MNTTTSITRATALCVAAQDTYTITLSRFPLINFFDARKSPYEYVHSVRIELAKLILVGTRITYQATGDAIYAVRKRATRKAG